MAIDKLQETLVTLYARRLRCDGDKTALLVRRGDGFTSLTWNQLAADVRRMAVVLKRLDVRPGDRVVQVAENSYRWIVTDLAVHLARGVHVAVHSTLTGPQIAYQISDSGGRVVVVSGQHQAEKLAAIADRFPASLRVVSYQQGATDLGGLPIRALDELLDQVAHEPSANFESDALAAVHPDNLATILYTSGTTGEPKGVMLSHRNLASNALATIEAFGEADGDLRLCWLPLSHIYARTSDLYVWLAGSCRLALAHSRDTILEDCSLVRPTIINGVPYFYEKICRVLVEQRRADEPGALLSLLGGRMRVCCAGGAALPNHVAEFFAQRGVPLVQGYGLTESSPVICTGTLAEHRIGTVGRPIPGVQVRIADDGEILTHGPHVMVGYWNKREATAEVLRGGWLRTGDLGSLTEEGYLRITGRKKELIVTAAGKNIAPVHLESLLTEDPLIAQAIIIGDARNYLTALIVPSAEALKAEILRCGIAVTSAAEAVAHPRVRELYAECIRRRLAGLSHCEQVGKFTLIDRSFTIESGELTPTLKLRRSVVMANFADAIRAMYE